MSYCPKCGNKVDETMTFCPRCGASLKAGPSSQTPPAPLAQPYHRRDEKAEKNEKQEKHEKQMHSERGEKQEKAETGFIGYLIGGLILITFGLFSVLQISGYFNDAGQSWAIMLLLIGVIIIIGAIYVATTARKRSPKPSSDNPA
jgi:predicted lipid-binding transport protein (Tim44 family)